VTNFKLKILIMWLS